MRAIIEITANTRDRIKQLAKENNMTVKQLATCALDHSLELIEQDKLQIKGVSLSEKGDE